jgi:hypothetical protein
LSLRNGRSRADLPVLFRGQSPKGRVANLNKQHSREAADSPRGVVDHRKRRRVVLVVALPVAEAVLVAVPPAVEALVLEAEPTLRIGMPE